MKPYPYYFSRVITATIGTALGGHYRFPNEKRRFLLSLSRTSVETKKMKLRNLSIFFVTRRASAIMDARSSVIRQRHSPAGNERDREVAISKSRFPKRNVARCKIYTRIFRDAVRSYKIYARIDHDAHTAHSKSASFLPFSRFSPLAATFTILHYFSAERRTRWIASNV